LNYYAYYQKRVSDGYRKNGHSDASAQFVGLTYRFSPSLSLKVELGRSTYTYQLPGPLTDAQFLNDPRQSTRSRNYFNPDIYLPSLTLDWQIDKKTKLNVISSAVLGNRNSVQFLAFADVADTIDSKTNHYKNRQVDIDNFHSYTFDVRLTRDYNIGKLKNTLATGVRYVNNDLHRRQLGKGTTGTDFDLSISGDFGRDLHSKTQNISVFVENLIQITPKLSLSPGLRVERGTTNMSGTISYLSREKVPNSIIHNFPLFGLSTEYKLTNQNRIYGGISQAYRPVIFSDVIPLSPLDRTDSNLKDAYGYNAEMGISGKYKTWLHYDVSYFLLRYNNRIGTLVLTENGQAYNFKTNTGNSLTHGLELYTELIPLSNATSKLSFFTASSYFNAHYLKGSIIVSNADKNITGNYLETVPKWISRNGINIRYKTFSTTLQYSYVAKSYSDALNTEQPSANGAKGIVPSYGILDVNMSLRVARNYTFKMGINNATNEQYFTKRPTGYPGVGVWSSDGRSVVCSFVVKY
jgi:Fe(3+) dicitrate transport protein